MLPVEKKRTGSCEGKEPHQMRPRSMLPEDQVLARKRNICLMKLHELFRQMLWINLKTYASSMDLHRKACMNAADESATDHGME